MLQIIDLTTEKGVVELMKTSKNEEDWNRHCDEVKAANGGYPPFWFPAIMKNRVYDEVVGSW